VKYYSSVLILGLLSFISSLTIAEVDLEAYGKLEQVSDVSISPNGELISYRRIESDDRDFIVVYSLKEKKMIAAVDVSEIDPRWQYFSNNDFLILVGSKHVKWRDYKHDFDVSTAFSFDIKNKEVFQLIRLGENISGKRRVAEGQSGLGRVAGKSVNGKKLYMPAYVAESDIDYAPNYSLLEINIDGKGKPRVATKGTDHTRDYFLDSEGNVLARENLNDRRNVHSVELKEGRKWRTLYSYEAEIPTHSFIGLNSDFTALVYSRNDDDKSYLQLSLKDGSVTPLEGFDAAKNTSGVMKNHHGVVVGVAYSGLIPDYHFFDRALHKRVKDILGKFEGHSVYLSDWTSDWKHIVVRVEGSLYAGDYFLFTEGQPPQSMVSSRLDIASEDINPIGKVTYKARDGRAIPTILTLPKAKMGKLKNLPTIIMPHGGPAAQDVIGFDYMAQALASRGYLVVQPQFRGSTGFGQEHYKAGWGQWGKAMQDDLTDGVNFFVKKGYADPARVCIVGASYGGYAALAGAAFTPDLYQCAVSIAGVSHLPKMLKADKSRYGKKSWVLDYWNRSILDGDYSKDILKEVSPYYSADKVKIPVLLLHGTDDTVVEYSQSKLMYKAMKKSGGNVKLIKLKNDDHYLQDSATRIQALKSLVEFIETHIKS